MDKEQIKKEFEEIGIKIDFDNIYLFTDIQEINDFQFKEIESILKKHELKFIESGTSKNKNIWLQLKKYEVNQTKLTTIKNDLDKKFESYIYSDTEIKVSDNCVLYYLKTHFLGPNFWEIIEKNNLELWFICHYEKYILLTIYVGDEKILK